MNYRYFTNLSIIGCLLIAFGLVVSCDSKTAKNTEQPPASSDSVAATLSPIINSDPSEMLKMVIGTTSEGFFRGLNFGDPVSKIKATETFELFEDKTDSVGYTYETENFESIDVLYLLDSKRNIKQIQIDVYVNSVSALNSLWDQFDTYLSGRFRNDKKTKKWAFWKGDNNVYVKLENISKGKDFGIKLSMGPKLSSSSTTNLSN